MVIDLEHWLRIARFGDRVGVDLIDRIWQSLPETSTTAGNEDGSNDGPPLQEWMEHLESPLDDRAMQGNHPRHSCRRSIDSLWPNSFRIFKDREPRGSTNDVLLAFLQFERLEDDADNADGQSVRVVQTRMKGSRVKIRAWNGYKGSIRSHRPDR